MNSESHTVPNFLIVGAARSGTTAVAEALRLHPQVFITQPKEPHFFAFCGQRLEFRGPGDEAAINTVAVTEMSRYLSLYDNAGSFAARGDGSVTTLHCAERAAETIRRVNPEMRLVVLLREPVDRAFSGYNYMRARNVEPESDFLRALELEPQRIRDNWHHMWHYAGLSRYAHNLSVLQQAVGEDRVGVWFYDDLQRDYARVIGEICQFLGVPTRSEELSGLPPVNVSGVPRVATAQHALVWATRHELVRSTLKRVITFRARERVRRVLLRSQDVPVRIREIVLPRFADDLQALRGLVPGELPTWLTEPAGSPTGSRVDGRTPNGQFGEVFPQFRRFSPTESHLVSRAHRDDQ